MMIAFGIGIVIFGLVLVSLVLPWLNRGRIRELEFDIQALQAQISRLQASPAEPVAEASPYQPPESPEPEPVFVPEADDQAWKTTDYSEPVISEEQEPYSIPARAARKSLEQQFGARLPVWIGGIALALAGVFLVKYSIDIGLLTQTVRVALGGVFGLGLLYGGHAIFRKPGIADGTRIAQALVGAGIADLYACLFAASSLYHLIPISLGFIAMLGVTMYAVIASLRYGAPIALLGLVGGFLTPALLHSAEPDAPLLLMYLYLIVAGTFAVIRNKGWWILGGLAIAGSFLWVLVMLILDTSESDLGLWVGLFLLATSVTVVIATRNAIDALETIATPVGIVNILTLAGAAALMALTLQQVQFDTVSWLLFWCLSAGGMGLAWFRPRVYAFVPCLTLALGLGMVLLWWHPDRVSLVAVILAFAALYIVGGHTLLLHSDRPVLWAGLVSAAALGFYLTAYYTLHIIYNSGTVGFRLWGVFGLLLAAYATETAAIMHKTFAATEGTQQKLLAVFATTATAFLSLALSIELPRDFLPVVFAAEMLAIAAIDARVRVTALRPLALVLALVFGVLIVPQIFLLLQLTAYSLFEVELPLQSNIPIVTWPLFQLGLPALFFAGAAFILGLKRDDALVKGFEATAVALLGLMGYYLTRHMFHTGETILFSKAGFIERGVITNVLFVYGLACLAIGRLWSRSMLVTAGLLLCAIGLFRIVYFDLAIANPLWSRQFVGDLPVVNFLGLTYGLPLVWLALAARELRGMGRTAYAPYAKGFGALIAFAWVTLIVAQIYQGGHFATIVSGNAEIYSYSVAWLLFGIATLVVGTARHDKILRSASLAIMLLTIGKVFLYDASELSGLYRIFSFLGLGVSLLGLSWFYTRFVFTSRNDETTLSGS